MDYTFGDGLADPLNFYLYEKCGITCGSIKLLNLFHESALIYIKYAFFTLSLRLCTEQWRSNLFFNADTSKSSSCFVKELVCKTKPERSGVPSYIAQCARPMGVNNLNI